MRTIKIMEVMILMISIMLMKVKFLTISPVALEGEGSNCFSITQLVGQKRAIMKLANAS